MISATLDSAFVPRAAATTVAPCAASPFAIAAPMPRDAPVTIATLPVRFNMSRDNTSCPPLGGPDGPLNQLAHRIKIVRSAERRNRSITMDLANEAAQHRARTDF